MISLFENNNSNGVGNATSPTNEPPNNREHHHPGGELRKIAPKNFPLKKRVHCRMLEKSVEALDTKEPKQKLGQDDKTPTTSKDNSHNDNPENRVQHDYHDYAEERPPVGYANIPRVDRDVTFCTKLLFLLDSVEEDGYGHVISWQPHGRCFLIRDPDQIVNVLSMYLEITKWTSFQRQMYIYGFKRITRAGPDRGGYYHPKFLRGRTFLATQISRVTIKGTKVRQKTNPEQEPNFWDMPFVQALPEDAAAAHAAGQQSSLLKMKRRILFQKKAQQQQEKKTLLKEEVQQQREETEDEDETTTAHHEEEPEEDSAEQQRMPAPVTTTTQRQSPLLQAPRQPALQEAHRHFLAEASQNNTNTLDPSLFPRNVVMQQQQQQPHQAFQPLGGMVIQQQQVQQRCQDELSGSGRMAMQQQQQQVQQRYQDELSGSGQQQQQRVQQRYQDELPGSGRRMVNGTQLGLSSREEYEALLLLRKQSSSSSTLPQSQAMFLSGPGRVAAAPPQEASSTFFMEAPQQEAYTFFMEAPPPPPTVQMFTTIQTQTMEQQQQRPQEYFSPFEQQQQQDQTCGMIVVDMGRPADSRVVGYSTNLVPIGTPILLVPPDHPMCAALLTGDKTRPQLVEVPTTTCLETGGTAYVFEVPPQSSAAAESVTTSFVSGRFPQETQVNARSNLFFAQEQQQQQQLMRGQQVPQQQRQQIVASGAMMEDDTARQLVNHNNFLLAQEQQQRNASSVSQMNRSNFLMAQEQQQQRNATSVSQSANRGNFLLAQEQQQQRNVALDTPQPINRSNFLFPQEQVPPQQRFVEQRTTTEGSPAPPALTTTAKGIDDLLKNISALRGSSEPNKRSYEEESQPEEVPGVVARPAQRARLDASAVAIPPQAFARRQSLTAMQPVPQQRQARPEAAAAAAVERPVRMPQSLSSSDRTAPAANRTPKTKAPAAAAPLSAPAPSSSFQDPDQIATKQQVLGALEGLMMLGTN